MKFENRNFLDIVSDKSGGNKKIAQNDFQSEGAFPIIDQGKDFIAGFTDDESCLVKSVDLPIIIFGDHTKILKFIDFPFAMGADGVKVLKTTDECDAKYIYHYLKSVRLTDAGYSRHFKFLKEIKIPLPPLDEQKRIAKILDKADELRQQRQKSIEKLDELLQATFIDMFGDPVINPKGWETKPLKNFALKVQSGNTPKGGKENYLKKGITFFRSQNVWKNKIIYDDIAFIDEETHKKMLGSSLKHKDILMTKTGRINTENSSLGRAAIYLGEDDKANLNGHVYLIRLSEKVNPFFILSILTLPSYYEYIRSLCVGGIDKRQLNKEHIESFSIIYPPIELQDKFAKIKQNIEQQKQILIKQLEQQENLFQSLQQRAFNGEI